VARGYLLHATPYLCEAKNQLWTNGHVIKSWEPVAAPYSAVSMPIKAQGKLLQEEDALRLYIDAVERGGNAMRESILLGHG
jgi:hypothetical protein